MHIRQAARLLIATALLLGWGASHVALAQDNANSEVAVRTVEVQPTVFVTSIDTTWQFSGTIQPKRRSELSFERIGRLDRVHVEPGDQVLAGQVLAELNTDQLQAQLTKLKADQQAAEAKLRELLAGARKESIAAAEASVREQDVQLRHAKQNYERRRRLVQDRLVSREELEQSEAAMHRLEASRENAKQKLDELVAGTRDEQIESQEAMVAAIVAGRAAIEVDLAHSQLLSPYEGTIIDRTMDEGAVVAPGRVVLTIIEHPRLEAHLGIPAETARLMKVGEPVEVVVRELKLPGSIRAIVGEVSDNARTQKLIVSLNENAAKQAVPGEVARIQITRQQSVEGPCFWLPSAALLRGPRGLWECYVVEGITSEGIGSVTKRSIEVIHTDGERVLVRGAVQENELVITSATHRITNGQKVKAVQAGATP